MTACQRKAMQYETIAERCECVLFHQSPFYYELGAMQHLCDGAGDFHGVLHAGGWDYARFSHLFWDQDPALARVRNKQGENLLSSAAPMPTRASTSTTTASRFSPAG